MWIEGKKDWKSKNFGKTLKFYYKFGRSQSERCQKINKIDKTKGKKEIWNYFGRGSSVFRFQKIIFLKKFLEN